MNKAETLQIFALMSELWPNNKATERTAEAYAMALSDMSVEEARAAVAKCSHTETFFPTVSAICKAAASLALGPERGGAEAWGDVVMAIRRVGSYEPAPEFEDKLVSRCVESLGWKALCLDGNDVSDRAQFIKLYDQLSKRQRESAVAGPSHQLPEPPSGFRTLGDSVSALVKGVGK